jgi:hypothetical protein
MRHLGVRLHDPSGKNGVTERGGRRHFRDLGASAVSKVGKTTGRCGYGKRMTQEEKEEFLGFLLFGAIPSVIAIVWFFFFAVHSDPSSWWP